MEVRTKWVTERQYAQIHQLSPQTLRNWRHQDRQAGRGEAAPGYPPYRRFGGAVRYELDHESQVTRPAA